MSRRIVDPIEFETKVNPENKRLFQEFLLEKESQGRAESSLIQFKGDMRILLTLILRHFDNKSLLQLNRKDIRNLKMMLNRRGLSSSRVNRLLSTLRSALEVYADDDDIPDYEYNIGSRVKGMENQPVREIVFLTDEQVRWLKDRLLEQGKVLQTVFLMLCYVSGKRKNEIYQVKKEGLTERFYTNKVRGKRGKIFEIFYDQEVQELIKRYLDERGPDDIPHLFVKVYKNGRRALINKNTLNAWTDEMSKMLFGTEKKIKFTPHGLRHSRVQNLKDDGWPLEEIRDFVNHDSVSTTEGYLDKKKKLANNAAKILGIDISGLKNEDVPVNPLITETKQEPEPPVTPVEIKEPKKKKPSPKKTVVFRETKKKEIEQLELF